MWHEIYNGICEVSETMKRRRNDPDEISAAQIDIRRYSCQSSMTPSPETARRTLTAALVKLVESPIKSTSGKILYNIMALVGEAHEASSSTPGRSITLAIWPRLGARLHLAFSHKAHDPKRRRAVMARNWRRDDSKPYMKASFGSREHFRCSGGMSYRSACRLLQRLNDGEKR